MLKSLAFGNWKCVRPKLSHRPVDMRVFLTLVLGATVYKCLSKDFSALKELCGREPLFWFPPNWLYQWVSGIQCNVYEGVVEPQVLQLLCALLLICCLLYPRRALFIAAFVALWLLDTSAFLWRANMWDLDTPLVILFIIALAPVNIVAATGWRNVEDRNSALLGLMILLFVSSYYFLAFLSKLVFDPGWMFSVNIGNYYSISTLMHGQEMPEWLRFMAAPLSDLMVTFGWLDDFAAFVVLFEQLLWILAPFILAVRYHAGIFSVGYHLFVLIATGIMFFTWTAIALGISVPWGRLWAGIQQRWQVVPSQKSEEAPNIREDAAMQQWCIAIALPLTIAFLPPMGHWMPPFYNYMQFGWSYPSVSEIETVYSVGWVDPQSNQLKRFPLNHGGFLEFRHSNTMDIYVRSILKAKGEPALVDIKRLRTLLLATREIDADGWFFGGLRAPDHLISDRGAVDMTTVSAFYLLQGDVVPNTGNTPARVKWKACGEIFIENEAPDTVKLYEECSSKAR